MTAPRMTAIALVSMLAGPTVPAAEGAARTSVNRNANVNRNTNVNRNVNVNQNVNVNRNVNVNVDRDVHVDVDRVGYGCCYHPAAAAAVVATTAVVTAAVVGSMVHTLPPSCTVTVINGISFQQCGSVWYQPQFSGSSVTYVVVNAPR